MLSLHSIAVLILIGGWVFGKIFQKISLPAILGMTLWGIGLSFFLKSSFPPVLWENAPFLKSLALIIILLRAGLGIHKKTLKKVGKTALFMSFVPGVFEALALIPLLIYFFQFTLIEAGMTAFMIAAVSPAVVIPSMLYLKENKYGEHKEVPTLVLAGASLDDVFAITVFTVFLDIGKGGSADYLKAVLSIPFSVVLGIIPGILVGFLLVWIFKKHHDKIRNTEKTLLLLGIAVMLIDIGNWIHTAALLGVMTIGFILLAKSEKIAHDLSSKLNKAWIFAEIILFVLIGLAVDIPTALKAGKTGLLVIFLGLIARSLGVLAATSFSSLNWKEKLFCIIAYIPKATVQAALGSIPLAAGIPNGEVILALAVVSILFTAPLGLLGIKIFGTKLLEKSGEG
ncbi:MAG TPA: peptidase [Spirochaetia bacterium]|nr:MAG: peptidase [Spirochaetes bacterium GWB1_36_13]HCL55743.1 peptidase [Spirochaetia bacterium]